MTLNLKMLATLDASGVKSGAREARMAISGIGETAKTAGLTLSQALDTQFGIGGAASGRAADIEAYGRELDDLRAKYNPLFAIQRRYETELKDISAAHKAGAISASEAADATLRANTAYQAQRAVIGQANGMVRGFAQSNRLAAAEVNMLGQQFADGAIQVASGQSMFTAILQQGSQVQFLLGSKGVNTIGGSLALLKQGFIGFLNPINLAIAGLAAGAAGASALYSVIANDNSATDALEAQADLIGRLAERYDEVGAAIDRLQDTPSEAGIALDRDALEEQRDLLLSLIGDIEQNVQRSLQLEANALSALAEPLTEDAALFRAFQEELRQTAGAFVDAETNADALIARLLHLAQTAPDMESESAIREMIREARDADEGLFDLVTRLGEVEAALSGIGAEAAALGTIDAAAAARIAQTFTIFDEDAARDRLRSLLRPKRTPKSAADRQADRTQDLIAAQDQTLERLRLEISLIGESDAARQKALAALEAEHQIRELGLDTASRSAGILRDNAAAIAEETLALENQQAAWDLVRGAGESVVKSLVNGLRDGDITGAIDAITAKLMDLALNLAVINPLMNSVFGSSYPAFGSVFGSGVLGGLLGGGPSRAISAATFGLYDLGGPTRAGNDNDIAGFVHANEYVFDAASTRKIGVRTLDAIRATALKGYEAGGFVTPMPFLPAEPATRAVRPAPQRSFYGDTHIHITTPDIQSFKASRSQIAGEFARLAVRGRRNG